MYLIQARSQGRTWGGAEPPKVDFWDLKSGLFEPHPLNPPTKTPFWAHFVAKSRHFARFPYPRYGPYTALQSKNEVCAFIEHIRYFH